MQGDFVELVKQLKKKIQEDEEKTYSKTVIEEYRNPEYFGFFENADSTGFFKGPCGDMIKITLKIKNNKIVDGRFLTDGCGATIAAGNMLIKKIIGMNIKNAKRISYENLVEALGGLPKEHLHCAHLAVNSLRKSIEDYEKKI